MSVPLLINIVHGSKAGNDELNQAPQIATMSTPAKKLEEYDLVVLGSGEGGKYLAWTLARQGQRVIVIERKWIGGSCPNIACLPSKNIIHSAKVASFFFSSEEFGISKENVRINMPAVRERKRKMVKGLVDMHLDIYQEYRSGTAHGFRAVCRAQHHRGNCWLMAERAHFMGRTSSSTPAAVRPSITRPDWVKPIR